jgi:outer membrane immunogenic protein
MCRLSTRLIVTISTLALAHTATAAGLPRKAATYESPPPPAYSWTGFYIGATIGGGWSDSDVNYVANDLVSLGHFTNLGGRPPPASIETSGVLGGLQVGYNWQVSPVWLIGAEADINWSGVKGTDSTGGAINIINAPFANTVEEKVKGLAPRGRVWAIYRHPIFWHLSPVGSPTARLNAVVHTS